MEFIVGFISVLVLICVYYDEKRAKKKQERQWEKNRRQQELEWEREAKQRQLEQEALARQMEQEEEASKQRAAKRAAEPMVINLIIAEKDANGMEIGDPKPLSLKLTLDEETATRLVQILHR